ncbi:hypothetical protein ACQP2F_03040 [Actinoplanes sp. CA-030573]|uniref:hypothetical protein n=1 Tax=Actinoplanes sp. CA-030573 TaxID=3239898 RepID=UPI003D8EC82D
MQPAWLAAGAACAGVVAAWWAAINGVRTLRQTRTDSRNRSRPMVAAELQPVEYSKGMIALVVRNFGPTIARNVRVTFDPPIPDPTNPAQSLTTFLKRRYEKPILTLTPDMKLSNLWFIGQAGDDGRFRNTEPTPEQCTVTIACESADGTAYEDKFVIDVALVQAETYAEPSTSPQARMKTVADSLKSLDASVKTIARAQPRPRQADSLAGPRHPSSKS